MKKIKFKGIRKDNGLWVYGNLLQELYHNFISSTRNIHYEIKPGSHCQFINLIDKNKMEIYEGDIDKSGLFIKYNNLHLCFGLFNKNGYQKELLADMCDAKGRSPKEFICSSIEIVGNIYEQVTK